MGVATGSRVGPYQIVARIGSGGMGDVYQATDTRLHRQVAIKFAGANFTDRSVREARLVAALNHPNICHVYDVGPNYLVMELVEGPTLADRLKSGPMPCDEAVRIAQQIADALEAAHEKGIVHRDLKPANVKVRDDGTAKVLDFGLATLADPLATPGASPEESPTFTLQAVTHAGAVMGTAAYMAPEQARGKAVDKRADIWAYGVVLYEMLTGDRLFAGETVSDTLAAVLTREPDWTRVPPSAERLLRCCIEKDPRKRLRNIGDARLLLEPDATTRTAPASSGVRWKMATAALVVVASAAWLAPWRPARSKTSESVMRLSVDFGDDALLSARRGDSMALSPDGSRVVYIVGKWPEDTRLVVRRLDQAKTTPLAGTRGAESPFFSPDGKFIAFFADGKLKRVEADGGSPVPICDAPANREGTWGEDDTIIFASRATNMLWRVPASGGTPRQVTRLDAASGEDAHRYPQFLPGSKAVLFMASLMVNGEGPIAVQEFGAPSHKILLEEAAYPKYLPSGHIAYMHQGTLFVAPFDAKRLTLTGPPAAVLEDVGFHAGTGTAAYTFSQSGLFLYTSVPPEALSRPLNLVGEDGSTQQLLSAGRYENPRVAPDGKHLAVTVQEGAEKNVRIYDFATHRLSRFFTQG